MHWSSVLSTERDAEVALDAVCAQLEARWSGPPPDALFLFATAAHTAAWPTFGPRLRALFPAATLVGCSAGGVIGGGQEVERAPGLSLTAAALPGVKLSPFHLAEADVAPLGADAAAWIEATHLPERAAGLLLLPDPFSCDAPTLLENLDRALPHPLKFGGLASGARREGQNALFFNEQTFDSGVVGLGFSGPVHVDTMVSQGCKPIGDPLFVTRHEGNLLLQLDGRPALDVLEALLRDLNPDDLLLARQSLLIGLVMEGDRSRYALGDYLIRNLLGALPVQRALAVAAPLKTNGVVQFHVRDAATAATDLESRLRQQASALRPEGGLMFSCLGRGTGLYGEAGFETRLVRRHLGRLPLGGFFCNGEIGPVGAQTWLHGYTNASVFFRGE